MQSPVITRQEYMSGQATHAQYYGQFVTDDVTRFVVSQIGEKALRASTDPHMNDIQLAYWDLLHPVLRSMCGAHLAKTGGTAGYSLSDSVCIAKQAARLWLEKNGASGLRPAQ